MFKESEISPPFFFETKTIDLAEGHPSHKKILKSLAKIEYKHSTGKNVFLVQLD